MEEREEKKEIEEKQDKQEKDKQEVKEELYRRRWKKVMKKEDCIMEEKEQIEKKGKEWEGGDRGEV